jgi:hypothetical protein
VIRLFRRAPRARGYRVEYEHPTQAIASAFLRAISDGDAAAIWERLSRETRGMLEGLRAARTGAPLHEVASADGAALVEVVAPLRAAALAALGGAARVRTFGVSAPRMVERGVACVLLVADVRSEGFVAEDDWRPAHLLAFVNESREWLVDLGRTSALSADAGLPDVLGPIT